MNRELQEILTFLDETEQQTVLAPVVDVNGSSYRLPGARMLITEQNGQTVGTISGGCLEADVVTGAMRVRTTGNAETRNRRFGFLAEYGVQGRNQNSDRTTSRGIY